MLRHSYFSTKNWMMTNSQDEIHFGVDILEQHGKRNQISPHHSYNHKYNLYKIVCKEKSEEWFLVKYVLLYLAPWQYYLQGPYLQYNQTIDLLYIWVKYTKLDKSKLGNRYDTCYFEKCSKRTVPILRFQKVDWNSFHFPKPNFDFSTTPRIASVVLKFLNLYQNTTSSILGVGRKQNEWISVKAAKYTNSRTANVRRILKKGFYIYSDSTIKLNWRKNEIYVFQIKTMSALYKTIFQEEQPTF